MTGPQTILSYVRPYRRWALFSLVMLLAMVVLDLAVPRLVQQIIDQGIRRKDLAVVLRTSALMILIAVLDTVATILNSNTSVRVGESVARDLREAVFVKIQRFSYGNLDRFSTGKLMVRLTSDASAVQRLTQITLRIGTRGPLTIIGSILLMFLDSPVLAASLIPILVVAAAAIVFFSIRMEPQFRAVQQRLDRLNTVLQENIAGARLVKAFVRADHEAERFGGANEELMGSTVKVMQFMSSMNPALTLLVNLALVLVVWLGGLSTIRGTLSVGQIVAFVNYLLASLNPLIMMTNLSNVWANGLASAKRINEVLDAVPEVPEAPDAVHLDGQAKGSVSFRQVRFHYNGNADLSVLEDICLHAEPGQTVALLGATGSGKSSLVNLIPRFYDASCGSVSVDGIDVRKIQEDSLLEHVAVVPQETILFSGTVRDNIRYGRPEATHGEVEAAAQAAQAHEFILRLPEGYDTHIEERGGNLSGGQKQRIAIARALVTRPSILILDDSTSAVDVETEGKIHGALAEHLRGCTVFLVAQRISTVLNADTILVIDRGRVVAQGRHAELLQTSPIYREIYDSQLGGGIHA
ncbi:MAG TPA: ABC transporter ATP-binding protein [Spirochaetia bacterium]|nr:ABC transporter ATP-binding protein [Spirochaetia bacterium]